MTEQNFKNHGRYVFGFHIVGGLLILAMLGGAITNLVNASEENKYDAWLILLATLILCLYGWYLRIFALRAQDRAIRAEEQLRYFILTGKRIDPRIRMGQIIALRFASDEEFPSLVQKAAEEGLKNSEIKKMIRNWRADYHRV